MASSVAIGQRLVVGRAVSLLDGARSSRRKTNVARSRAGGGEPPAFATDGNADQHPALESGHRIAFEKPGGADQLASATLRSGQPQLPPLSDPGAIHRTVRSDGKGLSGGHRLHGIEGSDSNLQASEPRGAGCERIGDGRPTGHARDDADIPAPDRESDVLRAGCGAFAGPDGADSGRQWIKQLLAAAPASCHQTGKSVVCRVVNQRLRNERRLHGERFPGGLRSRCDAHRSRTGSWTVGVRWLLLQRYHQL